MLSNYIYFILNTFFKNQHLIDIHKYILNNKKNDM